MFDSGRPVWPVKTNSLSRGNALRIASADALSGTRCSLCAPFCVRPERPQTSFLVDFRPFGADGFARSRGGQNRELQRACLDGVAPSQLGNKIRDLGEGQRGVRLFCLA